MRRSACNSLENLFKGNPKDITLENFYEIVGESTGNSLTNALFRYVNDSLDKYEGKENLDYIVNSIDLMMAILESNPDINRKSIKKKICKLIEKIDTIKIERTKYIPDMTIAHKELGKVENKLFELEQSTNTKESKQYKLLEFIIDDCRNLDYLEQTFSHLANSVNVVDKDGNSLFYNVLKKYIRKLEDFKSNKEVLLYYNNIILLMKNQKSFMFNERDKKNCLQLIYNALDQLRGKEKEFQKRKELLSSMKDTIMNDEVINVGLDELTTKYSINIGFNNSLIDELGIYQTKVSREKYPDRVFVDNYVVTIDGEYAVEIDDGLSAKKLTNGNYSLGVHIASPLSYIPYNSAIIKEAITRASCIYLPRRIREDSNDLYSKIIPMFPFSFSAESASLLEGEYRLAKSYFFEIDKEGNIVDSNFFKTIIKNNKKCTYEEVNSIIESGNNNSRLEKTIRALDEITYILEEKKTEKDLYLDLKSKRIDASNTKVGNSRAEKIINKTMMIAGSKVADYFAHSSEGYPMLYRTHSIEKETIAKLEEEIKKLSSVYDKEKFDKLYQILLGIYPKAKYDTSGAHEGLGLKHYCHCTSPLRRGADLVVEHALDVCYFTQPSDKELYQLEAFINESKNIINAKNNDIEMFLEEYYSRQKRRVKTK